jgi:endo-1,4-beta-xylanase
MHVALTRRRRTSIALAGAFALIAGTSLAAATPAAAASTLKSAAEAKGRYFGGEITRNLLSNGTVTNLAGTQFDMMTPGNEMKWDTTEPSRGSFNFGPGDQIVSFAQSRGMRIRGHNLVWHSQLAGWVNSLPTNQVQAAMENHIRQEAGHYRGKLYAWDVVNEPFNEDGSFRSDAFTRAMGNNYIADALRTARSTDPGAKLYLNDFNIEGTGAKSNAMFNLVSSLKQQGVPIDGVGFESHFIVGQIPSSLQSNMQRFANLGVDVAITELDVRMPTPASTANLNQQATDVGRVVSACLAVSRCVGISQWAVGDPDSWIPGAFPGQGAATLFDGSYRPKASFNAAVRALGGSTAAVPAARTEVTAAPADRPAARPPAVSTPASRAPAHRPTAFRPPAGALRSLAAPIGLRIGTAVTPFELDRPAYSQITGDEFSTVTPGNEMKWQVVEPTRGTFDWTAADRLVAFARAHGQLVRGHTLTWHNQLPTWLTDGVANGSIDNTALRALLRKHITDEATHFRGQIWQWDVANEFFTDSNPSMINPNDFWVAHLGAGILDDVFRWAHAADPHALLFFNDYNIGGEDGSNAKSNAVFAWAKGALARGVPLDGIGDQGHLDTQFGFPTQLTSDLQRYAGLGLKVAITEADVRTFVNNPTDQVPTDHLATFAQPYEFSQMLVACLAVPQCISFTVWGFGDANSWIPGFFTGEGFATIYDVNLNQKPAYAALHDDLTLAARGAPRRDLRR